MMQILYIKVEGGAPVNHPAFADNLIAAFGEIPSNWELFVRIEKPTPTLYQLLDSEDSVYTQVAGGWTDAWALREMSAEEKAAKQQEVKNAWAMRDQAANFIAWLFDEATNAFVPPIPRPATGNYRWSGAEANWKEAPGYPDTDDPYKFDFTQWVWVAV